jgi:hypothetical protein
MEGLTGEEKRQALIYAKNGADFMFVPSSNLCNQIIVGHPATQGINKTLVGILLTRKPIRLDIQMVIKYCMGTLDVKNTYLFDHGDIRVVPPKLKEKHIIKEDVNKIKGK